MTSPALVDAPIIAADPGTSLGAAALVVDDAALLDGAAAVWATLEFARALPATPENRTALAKAENLFLNELGRCGLGGDDLRRRLAELADTPCAGSRGSPLGA
jgi:hypothetical protein